jgi:hypothetical protein
LENIAYPEKNLALSSMAFFLGQLDGPILYAMVANAGAQIFSRIA